MSQRRLQWQSSKMLYGCPPKPMPVPTITVPSVQWRYRFDLHGWPSSRSVQIVWTHLRQVCVQRKKIKLWTWLHKSFKERTWGNQGEYCFWFWYEIKNVNYWVPKLKAQRRKLLDLIRIANNAFLIWSIIEIRILKQKYRKQCFLTFAKSRNSSVRSWRLPR